MRVLLTVCFDSGRKSKPRLPPLFSGNMYYESVDPVFLFHKKMYKVLYSHPSGFSKIGLGLDCCHPDLVVHRQKLTGIAVDLKLNG